VTATKLSCEPEVIFTETRLKGAFVIELERREDERGFFARSFCRQEFERGMNPLIAQSGMASDREKGTVRGMHFQFPPPLKPSSCDGRAQTPLRLICGRWRCCFREC